MKMYRKKGVLTSVSPYNVSVLGDDVIVVCRETNSIRSFKIYDLSLNWESNRADYSFFIVNNWIVSTNLYIYDYHGKVLYGEEGEWYSPVLVDNINAIVLYKTIDEEKEVALYHLFDVVKQGLIADDVIIPSPVLSLKGQALIGYKNEKVLFYSNKSKSTIWQQDLKSFYADDFDIQIKQVHQYKDTLIVVVKEGIVCLSLEDGSLIWRTENYALTLEVVGDFGYVCTGGSLYRIELATGLMYNYDREYGRLPDFDYDGKNYSAAGYRVVFHDGLLWYAVYSSGDSFIISIDPLDGEYKWIHKVDTFEKVMELQFHADKMFVSDSGGDLFIYQREA